MNKMKDFIVKKKLGAGSFASVYLVLRQSDNNLYAMKKVNLCSAP